MKKTYILLIVLSMASIIGAVDAVACTSAIIAAKANPYGRPLLWKNRDTSKADNKVEYVATNAGEHSYVALFNAEGKQLEEAWMGMNDAGFAIMNTASYNIKDDNVPQSKMDREGYLMTIALRKCRTVDDFANLLDTLPRPMGVEANFGVIDAYGDGAYFETNNHSFNRINLSDSEDGVIVRTNYSHTGRPNEGFGFVREATACHLLAPYREKGGITPEILTETVSRSFWHDLMQKDFSEGEGRWIVDQDFIPRYTTTATVVIEGCRPIEKSEIISPKEVAEQYIMWTGLGYAPCSEIVAVRCMPDGVAPGLRGLSKNGHSEIGDKAQARKAKVFSIKKGNGNKYIDMSKLFNKEGTGYVQTLVPKNLETYRKVREIRDAK